MKKILSVLLVLFTIIILSAQVKSINTSKSKITWIGKKVTGEHRGIIKLKEGNLIFKNKKVSGGSFIADMTTLSNTDQFGKDKEQLEGHLKSGDFFDVANFKTSKLIIKSVSSVKPNSYAVLADLIIKGKTNPVKFDMITKGKTATAKLIIDRTKYGVQYGSGRFFDDLGDRTINDEFELNVLLYF